VGLWPLPSDILWASTITVINETTAGCLHRLPLPSASTVRSAIFRPPQLRIMCCMRPAVCSVPDYYSLPTVIISSHAPVKINVTPHARTPCSRMGPSDGPTHDSEAALITGPARAKNIRIHDLVCGHAYHCRVPATHRSPSQSAAAEVSLRSTGLMAARWQRLVAACCVIASCAM
jgi:hypothetical protein